MPSTGERKFEILKQMANDDYIKAAIASRLFPDRPSEKEKIYVDYFDLDSYLVARNFVLHTWLKEPDRILTWDDISSHKDTNDFIDQHNVSLEWIEFAFHFCHRYRYINYGIY
jgi:hypothetical protein